MTCLPATPKTQRCWTLSAALAARSTCVFLALVGYDSERWSALNARSSSQGKLWNKSWGHSPLTQSRATSLCTAPVAPALHHARLLALEQFQSREQCWGGVFAEYLVVRALGMAHHLRT